MSSESVRYWLGAKGPWKLLKASWRMILRVFCLLQDSDFWSNGSVLPQFFNCRSAVMVLVQEGWKRTDPKWEQKQSRRPCRTEQRKGRATFPAICTGSLFALLCNWTNENLQNREWEGRCSQWAKLLEPPLGNHMNHLGFHRNPWEYYVFFAWLTLPLPSKHKWISY